jgi:hypothetical protein
MKKASVILFVLLAVYTNSAFAQEPAVVASDKPGWHKIGEVKASFTTESESIAVLGKDEFKSIKLKVTDAPINIEKAVVFYESGQMEEIPLANNLQAGAETKAYDLKHPDDEIKKVSFTYKSEPNFRGEKAHIELYGLKE